MNVFYTVDTEVWLENAGLSGFKRSFERDILGRTYDGDYGIEYQARELRKRNLKGVFFVEPLYASAVGPESLVRTVDLLQREEQDVDLHIHTEWLRYLPELGLEVAGHSSIRDFSEPDQYRLLGQALENLRQAGAQDVCAFRAGNYGADFNTLRALHRLGLRYDSSYNYCYLHSACGLDIGEPLLQPCELDGMVEVPISHFRDRPGHYRHAQLAAVSFAELSNAMLQAWRHGWQTFVIVSHSFELINRAHERVDPVVLDRFDRLCDFLAANTDKFTTRGFRGGGIETAAEPVEALTGSVWQAAGRMVEQARRWSLRTLGRPSAGQFGAPSG